MAEPKVDHRRATAERNVEAILEAAERILERRGTITVAAVAAEARLSRVTVYAHFDSRETLLRALVDRAVSRAGEAMDRAEPQRGPALEALDRVLASGWQELSRNPSLAQAAAEQLTPDALHDAHAAGHHRVRELLERGVAAGEFRADLPVDWLVTCCFALIHACGEDVRARRMSAEGALPVLTATLRDLLAARG